MTAITLTITPEQNALMTRALNQYYDNLVKIEATLPSLHYLNYKAIDTDKELLSSWLMQLDLDDDLPF